MLQLSSTEKQKSKQHREAKSVGEIPEQEKSKLRRAIRKTTDAGILSRRARNRQEASSEEGRSSLELGNLAAERAIPATQPPAIIVDAAAASRAGRQSMHSSKSHAIENPRREKKWWRMQWRRFELRIHEMRRKIYATKPTSMHKQSA